MAPRRWERNRQLHCRSSCRLPAAARPGSGCHSVLWQTLLGWQVRCVAGSLPLQDVRPLWQQAVQVQQRSTLYYLWSIAGNGKPRCHVLLAPQPPLPVPQPLRARRRWILLLQQRARTQASNQLLRMVTQLLYPAAGLALQPGR